MQPRLRKTIAKDLAHPLLQIQTPQKDSQPIRAATRILISYLSESSWRAFSYEAPIKGCGTGEIAVNFLHRFARSMLVSEGSEMAGWDPRLIPSEVEWWKESIGPHVLGKADFFAIRFSIHHSTEDNDAHQTG